MSGSNGQGNQKKDGRSFVATVRVGRGKFCKCAGVFG